METQPNVLLIVLDACRSDTADEHASTLRRLGEEGISFENAIAPATWTQPSHASLFTGTYPHDHGTTQPSQSSGPTDLMDEFADRGYSTHGVSGNGFVSPLWGYEKAFDTFRYTQTPEPFPKGLDTYTYLRNTVGETSALSVAGSVTKACLTHSHPGRSLVNLASVGTNAVVRRYAEPLTRIPHQTFAPNPQHTYLPEKNTGLLKEIIRTEAGGDRPFFAFANYMDTHRPYQAPADLQSKHLGRQLSKPEFERLNDDVAAPWEFIRLVQNDAVDDDDVETLRRLYAASVESVDRHLDRLIETLERNGVRDETVVVVVGDHGENLGETDKMGRRRFGHEASISHANASVPFVIAHPELQRTVEQPVSVKDVFELLMQVSDPGTAIDDISPATLAADRVVCEYPALGDESLYDAHSDIDSKYLRHRVSMDSVAAYENDWRVVVESDGTEIAFNSGERTEVAEAPTELVGTAREACTQLSELSTDDVTAEIESRLSDLGYV